MASNLFRSGGSYDAPATKPYNLIAPRTPGMAPSWISGHDTREQAEAAAVEFCRGRADLRGQDVCVELPSGQRVRVGTGP